MVILCFLLVGRFFSGFCLVIFVIRRLISNSGLIMFLLSSLYVPIIRGTFFQSGKLAILPLATIFTNNDSHSILISIAYSYSLNKLAVSSFKSHAIVLYS